MSIKNAVWVPIEDPTTLEVGDIVRNNTSRRMATIRSVEHANKYVTITWYIRSDHTHKEQIEHISFSQLQNMVWIDPCLNDREYSLL
jgi:hypothetical protein